MEFGPVSCRDYKGGIRLSMRYRDDSLQDKNGKVLDSWHQITKTLLDVDKRRLETIKADWRNSVIDDFKRRSERASEAERAKAEQERRAKVGSVYSYVIGFIGMKARTREIEASTIKDYEQSAVRLKDFFSDIPLVDLTREDVRAWLAEASNRYSPTTVRKTRIVLQAAVQDAFYSGIIPTNPVTSVKPPKRDARRDSSPNALDLENRTILINDLERMEQTPTTIAGLIAIYTGMRQGEVCGLLWKDIELDADGEGVIWVRRAAGRGNGGAYLKAPKTDRRRDVPIDPELGKALIRWKAKRASAAMKVGVSIEDTFVIGDPTMPLDMTVRDDRGLIRPPGMMSPDVLSRSWREISSTSKAIGTEGRRPTFHDLRHTFGTLAVQSGIDIKTTQGLLGHSSAMVTLDKYATTDSNAKRSAMRQLRGSFKKKPADIAEIKRDGTDG